MPRNRWDWKKWLLGKVRWNSVDLLCVHGILFVLLSPTQVATVELESVYSETASSVFLPHHCLETYICDLQSLTMWDLIFNLVCVVVTLRVWKMENCILEDLSVLINNWDPAQMSSPLWNLSRPLELLNVLSLYPKEMFSEFFYHVHLSLTWNHPLRHRAPWKQEPSHHYVWIRTSSESM